MKQDFKTEDLKTELERSLGFSLRSLERLGGASAMNFKAIREEDGFVFCVKCMSSERHKLFMMAVSHMEALRSVKAVRRIFGEKGPLEAFDCDIVCTEWCDGEVVFPDQLSEIEIAAFADDYLSLSTAMQTVENICDPYPVEDWHRTILAKCRGLGGLIVRRLLLRIPPKKLVCGEIPMQVIHGDFHSGNFLFANGRVACYMDLEELRRGYPTEDMIRYFICAAEHLRWYEQGRKSDILSAVARTVERMPYSCEEWLVAIDRLLLRKFVMKLHKVSKTSLVAALNLAYCTRFYEDVRRVVRRSCRG